MVKEPSGLSNISTKDLQKWGYDVAAKRSEALSREAAVDEAAPQDSTTFNGTSEVILY